MNKELADMVKRDLRVAREEWAGAVEALDKMLLLDFEEIEEDLTAKAIDAARGMKEKATMDATMTNLAFIIFENVIKAKD